MSKPTIIGLSGTFASGKDTLAHYLVAEHKFMHISTSDMVRQEAMRQFGSTERPILHKVANALRAQDGPGILITMALAMYEAHAEKYDGIVISGIRSIGEAEAIKENGGVLVFVDAPVEVRYERMASRKRDDESLLSLDEFKAGEAKELNVDPTDKTIQNLGAMRKMADVYLTNAADKKAFIREALSALTIY